MNRAAVLVTTGFVGACLAVVGVALWKERTPSREMWRLDRAYAKQNAESPPLRLSALSRSPSMLATRGNEVTQLQQNVAALETKLRRDGNQPHMWNDLGVALYALGRFERDPEALVRALAAVDRAARLAPSMPEPAFNRAKILDALGLTAPAALARRQYLAVDGDSHWADDVRSELAAERAHRKAQPQWDAARPRLEVAAVQRDIGAVDDILRTFPQEARAWCERDLLFQWAQAVFERRPEDAARALTIADIVGERLLAINGEGLVHDSAKAIRSAIAEERTDTLMEAYRAYDKSRILLGERKPTEAALHLITAENRFEAGNSPMALVARYYRAAATLDQRRSEEAVALLAATEAELANHYKSLRAQCLWERSRILGRAGKRFESLRLAGAAVQAFEELGEAISAARNQTEVASRLTWLGRPGEAWRIRRKVFDTASRKNSASLLQMALYTAARDELAIGNDDNARSLFALIPQVPGESPALRFDIALWSTYLEIRDDQPKNLESDLRALRASVDSISDPALREDAEDQMRFAESLLIGKSSPLRATQLLTETIAFRRRAGRIARVAEAHLERGRAWSKLQQYGRAEDDFHDALSALESQRVEIGQTDLRDAFFDVAGGVCNELLEAQSGRAAFVEAFRTIERCRARSLFDAVSRDHPDAGKAPLDVPSIQRGLSDQTLIAAYASAGDKTLVIVLSAGGLDVFTLPHPAEEIANRGAALVAAIKDRDHGRTRREARFLHDALIGPYAGRLDAVTTLAIVADESTASLPFALLEDSAHQRLIERVDVVMAPSASAFVGGKHATHTPLSDARVLAIGDPAFEDLPGFGFRRLRFARDEAQRVGQQYRQADVFIGEAATGMRFLQEVGQADLIHVAAHAVINPRVAASSFLLMAPAGGDSGLVYLPAIANLELRRAPLVILAGCETGVAAAGAGAIRSLATAFLAAGSRGVVGTLWDVDDEVTVRFSTALHQHLQSQKTLAAAVRAAQRELMNSTNPSLRDPSAWGSFVSFGS